MERLPYVATVQQTQEAGIIDPKSCVEKNTRKRTHASSSRVSTADCCCSRSVDRTHLLSAVL